MKKWISSARLSSKTLSEHELQSPYPPSGRRSIDIDKVSSRRRHQKHHSDSPKQLGNKSNTPVNLVLQNDSKCNESHKVENRREMNAVKTKLGDLALVSGSVKHTICDKTPCECTDDVADSRYKEVETGRGLFKVVGRVELTGEHGYLRVKSSPSNGLSPDWNQNPKMTEGREHGERVDGRFLSVGIPRWQCLRQEENDNRDEHGSNSCSSTKDPAITGVLRKSTANYKRAGRVRRKRTSETEVPRHSLGGPTSAPNKGPNELIPKALPRCSILKTSEMVPAPTLNAAQAPQP